MVSFVPVDLARKARHCLSLHVAFPPLTQRYRRASNETIVVSLLCYSVCTQ